MTVSGRKKFFLFAGVFCILFLPFIVLLLLSQKNRIHYTALKLLHRQDPNYTLDTTQFLFSSALPEIVIDTSPPNLLLLSFLLNKLSLLPFENLPYVLSVTTGIDKITPHTVEVVFYPITDLPKEDPAILQIVTNQNGTYRVAFAAGTVDRMKHYVTIPIYIDIHDPFFSNDPVYTLNVYALVGIFYTFHTPPLAPPDGTDPYMKFKDKVGDGFLPDMIFHAKVKKTSRVPPFFSPILSLVIKKTYAACLGTGQCGTLLNTYTCSSGPYAGQSCNLVLKGAPCPGFCQATTICQPNGQPVSCSTGSRGCRPYACGSCIVSHSCVETSNDCSVDSDTQCIGKYDCSGECVPPGGGSGRCRMGSVTGSDGKRICSCDRNYCSSQPPTPTPRPTATLNPTQPPQQPTQPPQQPTQPPQQPTQPPQQPTQPPQQPTQPPQQPTQPPQQPTQAPPPTQQPSSPTPTPRPPGTFRVRALQVSLADANNCSAPSSPLSSSLSFAPNLPQGTQSSDGTAYASWSAPPGTYTLIPTITAPNSQSFVLQTACVSRNGNLPSSSTLAQNIQSNDVVSYDLLYSLGQGWMRVTGGNVIACTDVSSVVPPSSPFFILNGSGGYPGFLSYGSSVSFDSSRLHRQGIERLSATQWILHNAFPELCDTTQTDFYQLFAYKFDISGIQPLDTPSGIKTKADFPQDITRVIGNVTLGGSPQDWSLSSNEKKTIFVNGNVTIQQNISYPDGGFFALIVNGNITIAPTVGSPHTSSAPSLRGFFATNPTGRFITGQSSNPGTEKLVVLGTVAAGGFTLQRNLDAFTVNHTTPAEEFIYDPSLLFSMPEQFKDVKIKWQEVPP